MATSSPEVGARFGSINTVSPFSYLGDMQLSLITTEYVYSLPAKIGGISMLSFESSEIKFGQVSRFYLNIFLLIYLGTLTVNRGLPNLKFPDEAFSSVLALAGTFCSSSNKYSLIVSL